MTNDINLGKITDLEEEVFSGYGMLEIQEYKKRYSDDIKNRIDFLDIKDDFLLIYNKLLKNKKNLLQRLFNLLNNNSKYKNFLSTIKNRDLSDYSTKEIKDIFEEFFNRTEIIEDNKVIFELYIDYIGYIDLINESKKSLLLKSFLEIEKYILSKSDKLLENDEKDDIIGEIIDDIEEKFDDIDFSDKYLFEKINKIIDDIKLDFIVAGNIFEIVKGDEVNSLDDLKKIGIELNVINTNLLDKDKKTKLLDNLMNLYYQNYDEKKYKDFLYELKVRLEDLIFNSDGKNNEFYLFELDDNTILSLYFKDLGNNNYYMGGFNTSNVFHQYGFGFWVLEEILKNKKFNSISAGILTKIDGFKRYGYERLIKFYKEKLDFIPQDGVRRFGENNEYIEIIKKSLK